MLHAGEDGLQGVIIVLRDRIEFMVVALRAADRQAQERGGRRRFHIVQVAEALHPRQLDIRALDDVGRSGNQKAGRHACSDLIAGESAR